MRDHWGIENNCPWQPDVPFDEDQCTIQKLHRDENFSTLRRIAWNLLEQETTTKSGVKNKRLTANWDDDYMAKAIFNT